MTGCDDPELAAANRFRIAIRVDRAFKRVFWTIGIIAAILQVLSCIVALGHDGASLGDGLLAIPQFFETAITGCVVYGSGPAVVAMLWVRFFPESCLGDETFWRK